MAIALWVPPCTGKGVFLKTWISGIKQRFLSGLCWGDWKSELITLACSARKQEWPLESNKDPTDFWPQSWNDQIPISRSTNALSDVLNTVVQSWIFPTGCEHWEGLIQLCPFHEAGFENRAGPWTPQRTEVENQAISWGWNGWCTKVTLRRWILSLVLTQ